MLTDWYFCHNKKYTELDGIKYKLKIPVSNYVNVKENVIAVAVLGLFGWGGLHSSGLDLYDSPCTNQWWENAI